ncbi:MAG: hypothetical protein Q7S49_01235 [bacterium]|nr:hypothetical protein [bacterium]
MTDETATPNILTPLRIVRIPAQPAVLTSEEYFKEAGVVWMGMNFKSQFLSLAEFGVEATDLVVRKLVEASLDALVLVELGDKAEILVSQFREFLSLNKRSPEWFIFYLRGRDEDLWTVRADWRDGDGGWFVCAFPVDVDELSEDRDGWNADDRIVSR